MGSEIKESKKRIYDLSLFFVIEHVVLGCCYTCYMTVHATVNQKLPVLFLPSNCAELTQFFDLTILSLLCRVVMWCDKIFFILRDRPYLCVVVRVFQDDMLPKV